MRKIVIRVAGLLVAALCVQVLITGSRRPDYPELTRLETALHDGVDVVYFGDSVLGWTDKADTDRRSIPSMLAQRLPGVRITETQHAAYGPLVFSGFCRIIAKASARPQFVLLPVNMHSFSPWLEMYPPVQFMEERYQLRWHGNRCMSAIGHTLEVLRCLNTVDEETWLTTPVYDGTHRVGVVRDFPDNLTPRLETIPPQMITSRNLVMNYMGLLRPDHPRVQALREACAALAPAQVQAIVYITPVDCETGTDLLGPRFRAAIRQKVTTLRSQLQGLDVEFVDMSEDLPASAFSYELCPNSHLKAAGRAHVAARVADALRRSGMDAGRQ